MHRSSARLAAIIVLTVAALLLVACGDRGARPTRTPVPTWTATPVGAGAAVAPVAQGAVVAVTPIPPPAAEPAALPTDTPAPPTPTPTEVVTVAPTETPIAVPTNTPAPTPTEIPSPTPVIYPFVLEEATKLPTESLARDVVRVWVYAYSAAEFGKEGYTIAVRHNGAPLEVGEETRGGLPEVTRPSPGPNTRFTNANVLFVEPQEGIWEVTLVDETGAQAGETAIFTLDGDETTRELYVRWKKR